MYQAMIQQRDHEANIGQHLKSMSPRDRNAPGQHSTMVRKVAKLPNELFARNSTTPDQALGDRRSQSYVIKKKLPQIGHARNHRDSTPLSFRSGNADNAYETTERNKTALAVKGRRFEGMNRTDASNLMRQAH